jgi:molecular chaperone HscB
MVFGSRHREERSDVAIHGSDFMINLQTNDFDLFDVPMRFEQDRAQLDARWKALQREAHPDRFAAEGAAAQRVAMQWSVRINEAYQRLKDPLKRAAYLCELLGAPVQAENNTAMPAAFLMQQMEWRENLDDTESAQGLEALADQVASEQRRVQKELARLLDQAQDPVQAVGQVRALMFIERFTQEVNAKLDRLT